MRKLPFETVKMHTVSFRLDQSDNEKLLDIIHFYSPNGLTVSASKVVLKLIKDEYDRLIKNKLIKT